MVYLVLVLLLMLCAFGPQMWVRYNMRRFSKTMEGIPGTGGELAEHLLARFDMKGFVVETTTQGDHFDPNAKAVRLSEENYHGKSITAVAVAAHEVGHAIQFHKQESIFQLRSKYIPTALRFKQVGILLLSALPIVAFVFKAPPLIFLVIGISLLCQFIGTLMFLIVLPEEWDASFGKALPILVSGDYVPPAHIESVRRVLKAAALTYFAGALADVLNIARWLVLLRR